MLIEIIVTVEIEVGVDLEKGHFQETIAITEGMIEVQATVDQSQDQEQVPIEIEIMCYKCREYNHFTKGCPTSKEKEKQNKFNKCPI